MKKPKSMQKIEPMTVSEFNAWLQGIEDMQPDGWAPTPDQWTMIKRRWRSVVENSFVPQQQPVQPTQPQFTPQQYGEMLIPAYPPNYPIVPTVQGTDPAELLMRGAQLDPTMTGGISGFE